MNRPLGWAVVTARQKFSSLLLHRSVRLRIGGETYPRSSLFYGDRLGEIPGLIYIRSFGHRHMVSQQLQRYGVSDRGNAIVVLAEERLALAVKRPEAFVKVDFDAAPSA